MSRSLLLIATITLLLCACAAPATEAPTAVPTEAPPTLTVEPSATATVVPPTETPIPPTATPAPAFQVPFFTCPGAVPIRVGLGAIARVTYSSGVGLRLRVSPRLLDANILDLVAEGDFIDILEGPECVTDSDGNAYVFWKIRDREAEIEGWAAEGEPGNYFIDYSDPPRQIYGQPERAAAYEAALAIMLDIDSSIAEKRTALRLVHAEYGEEILLSVLAYVPVYDDDTRWYPDFETFMLSEISVYGKWAVDSPYAQDPMHASLSIFFDPSEANVAEQLGLEP
jgi:hypothetical protein